MKYLPFLLLLLFTISLKAQVTEETIRQQIDTILELRFKDSKKAFQLAEKTYSDAKELGKKKLIGEIAHYYGILSWMNSDYDKAKKLLHESILLSDKKIRLNSIATIGVIYNEIGKLDSAFFYHDKAIKESFSIGDTLGIIRSTINMTVVLKATGNYSDAMEKLSSIKKLVYEYNDAKIIQTLNINMGTLLIELEDYLSAIEIFNKMIESSHTPTNIKAKALTNVGLSHFHLKQYKLAIDYYEKALEIKKGLNDKKGLGVTLFNMAEAYLDDNNLTKAELYAVEASNIFLDINSGKGKMLSNVLLGKVYTKRKLFEKANEKYEKAESLAKTMTRADYLSDIYANKSTNFEEQQQYPKALEYYKKYAILRKSLFNDKKQKRVGLLKIQYDTFKKDIEQQQLITEKNNQIKYGLGALGVCLIISVLPIFSHKKRQHNKKIDDKLIGITSDYLNPHLIKPNKEIKIEDNKNSEIGLEEKAKTELNSNEVKLEEKLKIKPDTKFKTSDYIKLTNRVKNKLHLRNVLYIRTQRGVGTAYYHCLDGHIHEDNQTLKSLNSLLEPHGFIQIHKSHIINIEHLVKKNAKEVILSNKSTLPIGRAYKGNLKNIVIDRKS